MDGTKEEEIAKGHRPIILLQPLPPFPYPAPSSVFLSYKPCKRICFSDKYFSHLS